MKRLGIIVIIVLPLVCAFYHGNARAQASTTTDASLVAKGRTRYLDYKCDECHGANGEGGGDGPDLIGTRLNADEISKFLEKPSPDAYMKGMPNIPANHPDNQVARCLRPQLETSAGTCGASAQPTATPLRNRKKTIRRFITNCPRPRKLTFLTGNSQSNTKSIACRTA